MSDTSFDERDQTLGYGRRTYQAACAPGVEVTEAQMYAMRRLAVALGLTPNGGKRARPEKLCALLAQHYASAPGSELAQLPRELRSLVMAMLDDRSARRMALASVNSAVDASTSLERRRAARDRLRELRELGTPLVFWLLATFTIEGYIDSVLHESGDYDRNGPRVRIRFGDPLFYRAWLERIQAPDGQRILTRGRLRVVTWYPTAAYVSDDLQHPLLKVALLAALIDAGDLPLAKHRDPNARPPEVGGRIIEEREPHPLLLDHFAENARAARVLAEAVLRRGSANQGDVYTVSERMALPGTSPHTSFDEMFLWRHVLGTEMPSLSPDVWDSVLGSIYDGPAGDILRGLDAQLKANSGRM